MTERIDIEPYKWGSSAWVFLDAITDSYPIAASQSDQLWMIDFLTNLADALPCETCRKNFALYLYKNPLIYHVSGRGSIKGWLNGYKTIKY